MMGGWKVIIINQNQIIMRVIPRIHFYLAVSVLTGLSLFIGAVSLKNGEWQALIASISLMVAIISAWMAYEVFYKQYEDEKPNIVLEFDMSSRYSLVLLVAKNLGRRPAFNIKFDWEEELKNFCGEALRFSKPDNEWDIQALNPGEIISLPIDIPENLFSRKDDNYEFTIEVSFQESSTKRKRHSKSILLSLEQYRNSLTYVNENMKTQYELQQIPKELREIRKTIKSTNNKQQG